MATRQEKLDELKASMDKTAFEREVLDHMLNTRKLNLMARIQPVNKMRKRLLKLQSDITSAEHEMSHTTSQALLMSSSMHLNLKNKEDWKEIKTKQIENDLQEYEDRQKFAYYLAQEHDKNLELEVLRKSVEERIELKKGLERQKDNEILTKELHDMDEYIRRQELQFKKIQKSTNVSSVDDLVPYYEYLIANEAKLAESVRTASERIERLSNVRTELGKELQRLMYSSEGAGPHLSNSDVQAIEMRLKERSKVLEDDEANLNRYEELVASSSNSVARIVYQVCENPELIDVNPETLTEHLALCGMKLEQMFNALMKRNILYLGESINTVKFT